MAFTTINKPSLHFNTKLYTGTGSSNAITGVGFQPDWVWIKNRSIDANHHLFDVIRGVTKDLISNSTNGEATDAQKLTAFGADGFTVGTNGNVNGNGNNIVSWNWKAGGTASANTDGDINSSVSVNTTAGFSIVQYTGTDNAGDTVGHGLGAVPKMIIVKRISGNGYDWVVYHANDSAGLYLNSNGYNNDSSSNNIWFNGAAPTSSVFSIGTDGRIGDATSYIAYCFAEKTGYSSFGQYKGNSSADGAFIYLGFKPAFFVAKPIETSDNWVMFDNKRDQQYNDASSSPDFVYANKSFAENGAAQLDFVSNGVKIRNTGNTVNRSEKFIYWAFAEAPLVGTNNIPCTAR